MSPTGLCEFFFNIYQTETVCACWFIVIVVFLWHVYSAPAKGEYGLEIYANDPELDGNSLYHAYQYLIICMESVGNVEPLPMLPPGFLGAQATFRKLGLSCATHEDPYIHIDSGDVAVCTVLFYVNESGSVLTTLPQLVALINHLLTYLLTYLIDDM